MLQQQEISSFRVCQSKCHSKCQLLINVSKQHDLAKKGMHSKACSKRIISAKNVVVKNVKRFSLSKLMAIMLTPWQKHNLQQGTKCPCFRFIRFRSVQDGIYAPGKAHIRSNPQTFPQRCLWSSSNVRLTDNGPRVVCRSAFCPNGSRDIWLTCSVILTRSLAYLPHCHS